MYCVYLDIFVIFYILVVDVCLMVGGILSDYVWIYCGMNIGLDGKLISFLYDNLGNFFINNVFLELVVIDFYVNYFIKVVSVCYMLEIMIDGELCIVVIYDDNGYVVIIC